MTNFRRDLEPTGNITHYGHPYGQPIIGICENSSWYSSLTAKHQHLASSITQTFHYADGVVQTCRTTSYHDALAVANGPALLTVRCVDTWLRPFRPERADFAVSLNTCDRRYKVTDQIFAIHGHSKLSKGREKKSVMKRAAGIQKGADVLTEPSLFDRDVPYDTKLSPPTKG